MSYAEYHLCSVVCHVGKDGEGHYFTYNFMDDEIVKVNDAKITKGTKHDLEVMETRSVLIFWVYQYTHDPDVFPGYKMSKVDQAIGQLRGAEQNHEEMRRVSDSVVRNTDAPVHMNLDEILDQDFGSDECDESDEWKDDVHLTEVISSLCNRRNTGGLYKGMK